MWGRGVQEVIEGYLIENILFRILIKSRGVEGQPKFHFQGQKKLVYEGHT